MNTIVHSEEEIEWLWFHGGNAQKWRVTAGETNGVLAMAEVTLVRGDTTPLHTHPHSDEIVYVLEGEILVYNDGDPRQVGPGSVVITPRDVPHAFVVTSEGARILAISTPGMKTESFYRMASTPGESGPVDFAKVDEAARETGAALIMGPPPFASQ
jgi:quercetin dioxygenase-like cupin family protein